MPRKSWILAPIVATIAAVALKQQRPLKHEESSSNVQSECRCFPGDECWPSSDEWSDFNKTLGGKLIATVLLAHICHDPTSLNYDADGCEQLRSVWAKPKTHYDTSYSPMTPWVSNQTCSPFTDPDEDCTMGRYVHYAVNATTAADYKETIAFASEHNVRLVIRNTGHDYYGKSTGAGGLALWTHNLKKIEFLDYKSADYKGKAIRVGAGVQVSEAQSAASSRGLVVVAGLCDSVGIAGGYTQGGGHGLLASKFGLAADQVLEWEVVTADGKVLVATPFQNTDLYWALSGGGGGTYGAVVSMTSKAYADIPVAVANMTFTNDGVTQDVFYDTVQVFLELLPAMVDAEAVPNWMYTDTFFAVIPVMAPGLTQAQLDDLFTPIFTKLKASNMSYQYSSREFSTYLEGYSAFNPAYDIIEYSTGGRMIPRSLLETESGIARLTTAIRRITESGGVVSGVTFNVAKFDEHKNSVNPIFRDAIFHLVVGVPWSWDDQRSNVDAQSKVTYEFLPLLEKLTPGGGAYLNEGDPFQPDWRQAFYGVNYAELKSIKGKYDPEHLFYGPTAVGSEHWIERQDGRLCKA